VISESSGASTRLELALAPPEHRIGVRTILELFNSTMLCFDPVIFVGANAEAESIVVGPGAFGVEVPGVRRALLAIVFSPAAAKGGAVAQQPAPNASNVMVHRANPEPYSRQLERRPAFRFGGVPRARPPHDTITSRRRCPTPGSGAQKRAATALAAAEIVAVVRDVTERCSMYTKPAQNVHGWSLFAERVDGKR
jgi:hypothetical protein